ncbi:helix-turn-helix domain-containing protein [Haliangium sp. UPWRP_2]|uniref:helix-turn-helix domain-containing protein n=1 Tax=Haliangium sp. UPWRP_2 TaxID=1931276 RepID=UPI000B542BC4|nr:helix-turn-helix domain-containing protein [Haliangium sp. UPWRP_2]PSM31762.1 helix-turn-helix domain-containing protein [Haliangium sp. UPWRP_2]
MTVATEDLQALSSQTRTLLTKLSPWAAEAPRGVQSTWTEHLARLTELAQFLDAGGVRAEPGPGRALPPVSPEQWMQFGRLLRDKRNAAGLSRVQLARRAKISDATIKFIESARHPPSRATLIRLIDVSDLKLHWADVPGHPEPPAPESPSPVDSPRLRGPLNCLLAPSYDPLSLHLELTSYLQGAGGYLEQTYAYLEPGSAAAYRTLCQTWPPVARLRSLMPLGELAQQIVWLSGGAPLQLLALGCGEGRAETQLAGCLVDAGTAGLELCLLDISPPLLTSAYHHAVSHLASLPQVHVWALQGNFHHLPLYAALCRPAAQPRRLITMLGATLANLDHEPRFLQQSLVDCHRDDLLLLELPVAPASCADPALIPRHDRLFASGVPAPYAAWLGHPLWRHCPQAERIEFHWELETRRPVPGSYALHAIATVTSNQKAERRFSVFRIARYDFPPLIQCLRELGWEELSAEHYGSEHSLRLYRKV